MESVSAHGTHTPMRGGFVRMPRNVRDGCGAGEVET